MKRLLTLLQILVLSLLGSGAPLAGVATTKHNLSVTGPGEIKAVDEPEICIFCHTPHDASPVAPLWNRRESEQIYIPYSSSTAQASPGQPTGASILCLSCHDGTIALGDVLSRDSPILMAGGSQTLPEGRSNLGTDLSDDHPISFHYTEEMAVLNDELVSPSTLTEAVKLDDSGQLQCTSCHDPHEDLNGKFLVVSLLMGELCTVCHKKDLLASSHGTSTNTWDGSGLDPWPNTDFATVDANSCLNCHTPHLAGAERLLNYAEEELNCLVCHNGHVADTDIETLLDKAFVHPVRDLTGIHDAAEPLVVDERHAECEDCHNPHAVTSDRLDEPSGALLEIRGVSIDGVELDAIYSEYQLCFRCHGDSALNVTTYTNRLVPESNTRVEFSPSNPSYHPVAAPGVNTLVPSLIPPLSVTSVIRCTDCHNNDDLNGPRGPHGSDYRPLLEREYITVDPNPESELAYALCYKCHDRSSILSDESFPLHSEHITGSGLSGGGGSDGQRLETPCNVCHDPHGVRSEGEHSGERLINFDLDVVGANSNGDLYFQSDGLLAGTCSLQCHGKNHLDCSYDAANPGESGACSGGG